MPLDRPHRRQSRSSAKQRRRRDRRSPTLVISDLIFNLDPIRVGIVAHSRGGLTPDPKIERAHAPARQASIRDFGSLRKLATRLISGASARRVPPNTIELLESRKRLSSQAEILTRSLDKERALATEQRNSSARSRTNSAPLAIDGHAQRLITTRERAKPPDILDRAEKIRAAVFR